MTRKLGWLVLVGAVAFACGEAGQSMSNGAGAMDGGGGTTNSTGATTGNGNGGTTNGGGAVGGTPGQNVREVECKEGTDGSFPIDNPGEAYAIACRRASERLAAFCYRSEVFWFTGTNNGFLPTCIDVVSVTLYD